MLNAEEVHFSGGGLWIALILIILCGLALYLGGRDD